MTSPRPSLRELAYNEGWADGQKDLAERHKTRMRHVFDILTSASPPAEANLKAACLLEAYILADDPQLRLFD